MDRQDAEPRRQEGRAGPLFGGGTEGASTRRVGSTSRRVGSSLRRGGSTPSGYAELRASRGLVAASRRLDPVGLRRDARVAWARRCVAWARRCVAEARPSGVCPTLRAVLPRPRVPFARHPGDERTQRPLHARVRISFTRGCLRVLRIASPSIRTSAPAHVLASWRLGGPLLSTALRGPVSAALRGPVSAAPRGPGVPALRGPLSSARPRTPVRSSTAHS